VYVRCFIQLISSRLTPCVDENIGDRQCEFQCIGSVSAGDQIFYIRQVAYRMGREGKGEPAVGQNISCLWISRVYDSNRSNYISPCLRLVSP
jgi:hypothetical protein